MNSFLEKFSQNVLKIFFIFSLPKKQRWFYRNKQGRNESIEHLIVTTSGRYKVKESRLIVQSIEQTDNTNFFCMAINDQGSETLEIQLKVTSSLQAHIQPQRQTVDVGKSADLVNIVPAFSFNYKPRQQK